MNKLFSIEIFVQQISKIMEDIGLRPEKDDRKFDRMMGFKNQLYRWRTQRTKKVTLENAMLIANKFDKSLDWLIFGKEPLQSYEHRPILYDARQPAPADSDLIAKVSAAVQQHLNAVGLKIGPNRLGKTISLGYEQCVSDKIRPQELNVKALLVLTALVEE